MGKTVKDGNEIFYQQDNGEITARFTAYEEKTELIHEGIPRYKIIFYLLIAAGFTYLALIFLLL